MNISLKNKKGKAHIDISIEAVNYEIVTDEKYDINGNQHISSSIIDTTGFPQPTMDKQIIIQELSKKGIIIDNK